MSAFRTQDPESRWNSCLCTYQPRYIGCHSGAVPFLKGESWLPPRFLGGPGELSVKRGVHRRFSASIWEACGRVSGMQGTAEWLGPGRHAQQGGQSYQLWTMGSAPEAGTRSIFPSQVRGTPQTVGIQGSSWGLLTSRKPREALERIQRFFLWSVLCPSVCAHMGGRQVL